MKISVDRVKEMIAAFKKYDADHPKALDVDMSISGYDSYNAKKRSFCGTPGCHAGLFGVLFCPKGVSYLHAADQMAKFLSQEEKWQKQHLEGWAGYSGHWPNDYGEELFKDSIAFGRDHGFMSTSNVVSIKEIIETWKKVVESLEEKA